MKRFILLAFAFLAVAFYELSGGKDFDAEETRQASQDIRLELETMRSEDAEELMAALPPVTGRAPLPATVDVENATAAAELDLASFSSVVAPERTALPEIAEEAPEPDQKAETNETAETSQPIENPRTDALPQIQLTAPAVIALSPELPSETDNEGIAFAGLSVTASSDDVTLAEDIRIVSARRVNLRAGPGLGYDVLDQLALNTRVEILEDAGNGWVRLRPTGGGVVGWAAEFLLTDG